MIGQASVLMVRQTNPGYFAVIGGITHTGIPERFSFNSVMCRERHGTGAVRIGDVWDLFL